MERKALCFLALEDKEEALKWLQKSRKIGGQKVISDFPPNLKEEPKKRLTIPQLKARNSVCPGLSDSVRIEFSRDRGRFGVANRNIKAGELILVENPTAAVVKTPHIKDHCQLCLKYSRLRLIEPPRDPQFLALQ